MKSKRILSIFFVIVLQKYTNIPNFDFISTISVAILATFKEIWSLSTNLAWELSSLSLSTVTSFVTEIVQREIILIQIHYTTLPQSECLQSPETSK